MVPDSQPGADARSTGRDGPELPDGGTDVGFDEVALYTVVRKAVEDAILDVIGTLLLVGVALVVVWIGAAAIVSGTTPGLLGGTAAILFGVYLAAATLEVIPPAREWL